MTALGCEAAPEVAGDPGPCGASVDCPTAQVCVQAACVDAWDGLEYRVVGVSVDGCADADDEYAFSIVFDERVVASALNWRSCPAAWSDPDLGSAPFVPTDAAESFRLAFDVRYGPRNVAVLEWQGIPRDVLHYGQWSGSRNGHSIDLWLELGD